MIVLGIETSCDETSVSIVRDNKGRGKILVDGEVGCTADMLITSPEILEEYLPKEA